MKNVFPDIVIITRPDWQSTDAVFREVYDWCAEYNIPVEFKNHWTEPNGHFISFSIPVEKQFWFKMRWL